MTHYKDKDYEEEYGICHTVKAIALCSSCHKQVPGLLKISRRLRVVDSPGFMLFGDGIICERCMALEGLPDPNKEV